MKTIVYVFLFISVIVYNSYSQQSGWFWQNPLPAGNNLLCVSIVNENLIYASGNASTIIKSTNAGQSWTLLYPAINCTLNAIYFTDANTGWAAGSKDLSGIVIKTVNGGINWVLQSSDTVYNIQSLCFINNSTGWAAGGYYSGRSIILKTTNGGTNWVRKITGVTTWLNCIKFIDALTGWAVGSATVIKTTDGGESWFNVSPAGNSFYRSVDFVNNNTGWIAGGSPNPILKTTNGGNNWFIQLNTGLHYSLKFTSPDTGYVVSNTSNIWYTTNAGLNWLNRNTGSNHNLLSVNFLNSQTGFAVGWYGQIIKTTNSGINWNTCRVSNPTWTVTGIHFTDQITGWCVTSDNYSTTGKIYKTTNGGTSWNEFYFVPSMLTSIYFINPFTGWALGYTVGTNGFARVFFTTNSGINWDITANIQYTLSSGNVFFFNDQTGFFVFCEYPSTYGRVAKTSNGGINWNIVGGMGKPLNYLKFFNSNTGIGVGQDGAILRTTNAGINWIAGYSGFPYTLSSLHIIDNDIAYVSGYGGILKTTDAGFSFINQAGSAGHSLYTIFFVNPQVGWGAGYGGDILYTTNAGINWILYERITYNGLGSSFFISETTGWFVGEQGTILKTTNGGGILSLKNINEKVPQSFSLSQNYPNPFNPVTHLRFEISERRFASLKIYDILGREITTLVNEKLNPGTYEVNWDATNYPSGVYFYKLVVGDNTNNGGFYETKKMVLVK